MEDFFEKFDEIEKDFRRSSDARRPASDFSDIYAGKEPEGLYEEVVADRAKRFGRKNDSDRPGYAPENPGGERSGAKEKTAAATDDLFVALPGSPFAAAPNDPFVMPRRSSAAPQREPFGANAPVGSLFGAPAEDSGAAPSNDADAAAPNDLFIAPGKPSSAAPVNGSLFHGAGTETPSDDVPGGDPPAAKLSDFFDVPSDGSGVGADSDGDARETGLAASAGRADARRTSGERTIARRSARTGRANGGAGSKARGGGKGGGKRGKGRKKHRTLKTILATLFIVALACMAVGVLYVYSVIKDVPEVDPSDITARLRVVSTMYDDAGNPVKNIYMGDVQRTIVKYEQLPEHLKNAFIAIEDKTFRTHHGFNFVRMVGAVRDSLFKGGRISGTSTITQQLARNIFLVEDKSKRTLKRKLEEAYYAVQLEKKLGKDEILTDYLNTIPLGNRSYGVQTAAKSYFNKNVEELTLIESAALACLAKSPTEYAMIKTVNKGTVAGDDPRMLLQGQQYDYLYNERIEPRLKLVLDNMLEQELITQAEYDEASADVLRNHLQPTEETVDNNAAFFVDYAIDNVAENLMKTYPEQYPTKADAIRMVYTGGLKIHTTLNTDFQNIMAAEYGKEENFPQIVRLKRDGNRNILDEDGNLILFRYENMFAEDGRFIFGANEARKLEDGSLMLLANTQENPVRLKYYSTVVEDRPDVRIDFKDIYQIDENGKFYIIKSSVINVPPGYSTMDEQKNVILSAKLFTDYPDLFAMGEDGSVSVPTTSYTLGQKVIQPQSAMVVLEHATGHVKAMYGGRNIAGEMNFNRAVSPRQPGSSMKPIGTYGPAIQMSAEKIPITNGEESYGKYWSPL
ncbi:MAG: transglycosylase domain-containing protein, partial [Clostridiales Family XIII bacterium]|nr:transglycosylase domain-containing protein [Clostridiales Family XIII bacterium]